MVRANGRVRELATRTPMIRQNKAMPLANKVVVVALSVHMCF